MALRHLYDRALLSDTSKKHDDPRSPRSTGTTTMLRTFFLLRRRRIFLALGITWLLYLFVKNIPTDLPPISRRASRYDSLGRTASAHASSYPEEEYEGPVRYYSLAATVRPFLDDRSRPHVLFALGNPESASTIVMAACDMASRNISTVHVALMGVEEMALEKILKLNGIREEDCLLYWHDARADLAAQSNAARLARAAEGALGHLHHILDLKVVFYDSSTREAPYLQSGLSKSGRRFGVSLIRAPSADTWMLGLDARSLNWWGQIQIDIVVRVQPETAGSLRRLLRSIRDADYGGLPYPRIILDIPARADMHVLEDIADYQWPPGASSGGSLLSVRHRVDDRPLGAAAVSVQVVESFYPTSVGKSHVLMLSPEVVLSRSYFQLLTYLILEYRYGERFSGVSNDMMGISLLASRAPANGDAPVSLVQHGSPEAALFFGEKWAEFHQYLSLRFVTDPDLSKSMDKDSDPTTKTPTWMRLAMEMMQAQGYMMLQPQIRANEASLATLHEELQLPPEEDASAGDLSDKILHLSSDSGTLKAESQSRKAEGSAETRDLSRASLVSLLVGRPAENWLQIPAYGIDGQQVSPFEIEQRALEYSRRLATTIGRCLKAPIERTRDLDSLFC
jgi:hypothetical protein